MIRSDDDSLDLELLEAIADRLDTEPPPPPVEEVTPVAKVFPFAAIPRPRRTGADTPAHGLAAVASAATSVPR